MKAGNGILHDETLSVDYLVGRNRTHAFQFFINLPSKNKAEFQAGKFVALARNAGEIAIGNNLQEATDILLFGGEPHTEPTVAEGSFVLNIIAETGEDYRDYFARKYGKIILKKKCINLILNRIGGYHPPEHIRH